MDGELRFERGTADLQKLRAATDAEWAKVIVEPRVRQSLEGAGIDADRLPVTGIFDIKPGSSGFDVSGADVLIALGGWATGVVGDAAKEILLDAWRRHVRPRIADRLGDDAVGPEKD